MRVIVLLLLALCSCKKAPPPDPICAAEPFSDSSQGAIQIAASTDTHFYIFDEAGKQLTYSSANKPATVKPGQYRVKINSSVHPVYVEAGKQTKCSTGTVLVTGATDEHYYIFDTANAQLAYQNLGKPLSLFPGAYQVQLNKTTAAANVDPNSTLELKAGLLDVQGTTDEHYYLFDPAGAQLCYSQLNKPVAVLAGAFVVKVNGTEAKAEIRAGETTKLQSGTLLVQGSTDSHYYAFSPAGAQLAYQKLSKPLALLPGPSVVKVNGSSTPVEIAAGAQSEIQTGTLLVQGTTDEHYYVFDAAGAQLVYSKLSQPVSLLEGSYTAKVTGAPFPVEVKAARTSEYKTGTLTVKGAGADHYYVLDPSGAQLGYQKLNQPLALPAGKYSVKVGGQTRPVSITAGAPTVLGP